MKATPTLSTARRSSRCWMTRWSALDHGRTECCMLARRRRIAPTHLTSYGKSASFPRIATLVNAWRRNRVVYLPEGFEVYLQCSFQLNDRTRTCGFDIRAGLRHRSSGVRRLEHSDRRAVTTEMVDTSAGVRCRNRHLHRDALSSPGHRADDRRFPSHCT